MPLDLELLQKQREQELADLLQNRQAGIAPSMGAIGGKIAAGRDIQGAITPLIGQLGLSTPDFAPAIASASSFQGGRLERALSPTLGRLTRGANMDTLNLIGSNKGRLASDSILRRQNSENFARESDSTARQQSFLAGQSQGQRKRTMEQQQLLDDLASQGLTAEQAGAPQDDYTSALLRALGQLGGAAGSYAAYGGFSKSATPSAPLPSGYGYGGVANGPTYADMLNSSFSNQGYNDFLSGIPTTSSKYGGFYGK